MQRESWNPLSSVPHDERIPKGTAALYCGIRRCYYLDGRLDNREEFFGQRIGDLSRESTDLEIVAAAYEHWGTNAFATLIGDWALSIWSATDRTLILAKDFVGTRPLFYLIENHAVAWSTILDPLVTCARRPVVLDYEYLAGSLSFFPAPHLSPYLGIHSVPPSSFVTLSPGRHRVTKYWDFNPSKRFHYRTDGEYEEHFRAVFADSVRRRLRSGRPVLAELSGGMDSSSIVCMADTIIASGNAETSRLDTVSYYDDSEPNWNERPYFTAVEQKRGRAGCHIDVGSKSAASFDFKNESFRATPWTNRYCDEASKQFAAYMLSLGSRIVLSGTGGDEIAGGVPTPIPELSDLMARARLKKLVHQLKVWALEKRKPWFYLLCEAARGFVSPILLDVPNGLRPAAWLHPAFVQKYRSALTGYPKRLKLFGALPSYQENISSLGVLRRQLGCVALSSQPPYEKRYPYLDRDLLEFIFGTPREQLVRPGHRRSLMRRALVGTVPEEVLNRRRKAFVIRAPLTAISTESASLVDANGHMISDNLGIVAGRALYEAVQSTRQHKNICVLPMIRMLGIEYWFRHLAECGLLQLPTTTGIGS